MSYAEKAREHLEDCIYPVLARAEVFSKELGMSVNTLRRRLQEEGTSWNALYKAEIHKRIVDGCNQGLTAPEINASLGYADVNVMHRVRREAMREYILNPPSMTDQS